MSKGKVLVVDDEQIITSLVSKTLEREGYQVIACNSAEDGLATVRANSPDLILLDIGMPDIDGYEFCSRLRKDEQFAHTPVIFLSGKSAEEDGGRSFKLGAATYIRKPFSNASLVEIVNLTMSSLDG